MKKVKYFFLSLAFSYTLTGKAQSSIILKGHVGSVLCVAFSPIEEIVVTTSSDRTAKIWSAQTGNLIRTLSHNSGVSLARFSPDGKILFTSSWDGEIRKYAIASGELLRKKKFQAKILDLAVSPVTKKVLISLDNNRVLTLGYELNNTYGGVPIVSWYQTNVEFEEYNISCIDISRDGSDIIKASGNRYKMGSIYKSGYVSSPNWTEVQSGKISSAVFSQNGKSILFAGSNGIVWGHTAVGFSYAKTRKSVNSAVFSHDSKIIAAGSADSVIYLVEFYSGKVIRTLHGHSDVVTSVCFSPDSRKLASASEDGTARIWSLYSAGDNTNTLTEPSDVDQGIPEPGKRYPNRYALIIGNEDYASALGISSSINVPFAANDAKVFAQYAEKVLGIDSKRIFYKINATRMEMDRQLERLYALMRNAPGKAEVFIYYSGHGYPDEKQQSGYLMPVDVPASAVTQGIRVRTLLDSLSTIPSRRAVVMIDACFSGLARSPEPMLAVRAVIRTRQEALRGNCILLSACQPDQTSLSWERKQHGMFTYHLLKHLKETKGQITYKALADALQTEVNEAALIEKGKTQKPMITFGTLDWEKWKVNE